MKIRLSVEVCALPPTTVATGARVAAGRLDDGEPVYFDFLPQISTIVSGEDGARNFDLISRKDLVPAGETFWRRAPVKFVILAGRDRISVFIRKETVPEPRLANVSLGKQIAETTPVELSVEQQPVSGRALLKLSSPAFITPLVVDFETAKPQEKSWNEIIESLERPQPTIPDRMVLPNGLEVWDGTAFGQGLSEILEQNKALDDPNWKLLAQTMSSRPNGRYALNSDGQPPEEVSDADLAALDQMLIRAEREVHRRIAANDNTDNDPLRFATWAFRRCPLSLVEPMLEALDSAVGKHPLLPTGGAWTLIYQALGRTMQDKKSMRHVMDHLFERPSSAWNKNHVACVGFLISRTNEALGQLRRNEIDYLATVVARGLEDETGGNYNATFIYLPILLVGLLRWRMVEPYALVSKWDRAADQMGDALNGVIDDLASRRLTVPRLQRHHDLLCKSRDELAGEGGHSNLLVEIHGLQ